MSAPSGPSERAAEAAAAAAFELPPLMPLTRVAPFANAFERRYFDVIAGALHDPGLGLDRSVCLRDVVRMIDDLPDGRDERLALLLIEVRTLIEREFTS